VDSAGIGGQHLVRAGFETSDRLPSWHPFASAEIRKCIRLDLPSHQKSAYGLMELTSTLDDTKSAPPQKIFEFSILKLRILLDFEVQKINKKHSKAVIRAR
jgi:hypothetical protein